MRTNYLITIVAAQLFGRVLVSVMCHCITFIHCLYFAKDNICTKEMESKVPHYCYHNILCKYVPLKQYIQVVAHSLIQGYLLALGHLQIVSGVLDHRMDFSLYQLLQRKVMQANLTLE